MYVYVIPCLPVVYTINPEGLMVIAECIHDTPQVGMA